MEWIKHNWVILAALVAMGTAWGRNEAKIQTLEDAVKTQAEINKGQADINKQFNTTQTEVQKQNSAIDERTKIMLDMLKDIKRNTQ